MRCLQKASGALSCQHGVDPAVRAWIIPMKRLTRAPNLALATFWSDLLNHAGIPTTVQRQYASSIAGELPPDQALPEVWVQDDALLEQARSLLHALRHPAHRRWACPGCHELIDGPFE